MRSSTPSEARRIRRSSLVSEQKSFDNLSSIDSNSESLNMLYSKRQKKCKKLLDKLSISYQRHVSLKKYSKNMQKLETSTAIAKQELKSHFDGLIAELSHKLEEATNQLEVNAKAKESLFKDRDCELECYITTIQEAHQALELKVRAQPKGKFVQNYLQTRKEAEEALEALASELLFDGESCSIKCPEFCYVIRMKSEVEVSDKSVVTKQSNVDLKSLDRSRPDLIAKSQPFISVSDSETSGTSNPSHTLRAPLKILDEPSEHRRKNRSSHKCASHEAANHYITESTAQKRYETSRKDAVILDLVHKYKDLEGKYLKLKAETKRTQNL